MGSESLFLSFASSGVSKRGRGDLHGIARTCGVAHRRIGSLCG